MQLRLLPEMAKREAPSDLGLLAPLAPAKLETLLAQAMLRANLLAKATQLPLEMVRPVPANRPLAEGDLDLRRLEQHLVRARLLAGRAKPQDSRRR